MPFPADLKSRGYKDPATCKHENVKFLGGIPHCNDCCSYGDFNFGTDFETRPYIWDAPKSEELQPYWTA